MSKKQKDQQVIKSYKGFDKNMQCRGFQFKEGETYKHEGAVEACASGFHSCENPLDVLNYYDLCDSRFASVTVGGEIGRHSGDSKIASAIITIDAEIKLPEFIKAAVNWLMDACKGDDSSQLAASGHSSKLAASGHSSKLAASGHYSQLAASGDYSQLAASGHSSKLAASGHSSQLAASGDYSQLAASGHSSQLAASGHSSQLAASGHSSVAACVGTKGQVKAGPNGALVLTRWVENEKRYRVSVAYTGENGIKPDVWYTLDDNGLFIEVS